MPCRSDGTVESDRGEVRHIRERLRGAHRSGAKRTKQYLAEQSEDDPSKGTSCYEGELGRPTNKQISVSRNRTEFDSLESTLCLNEGWTLRRIQALQ